MIAPYEPLYDPNSFWFEKLGLSVRLADFQDAFLEAVRVECRMAVRPFDQRLLRRCGKEINIDRGNARLQTGHCPATGGIRLDQPGQCFESELDSE